MVREHISGFLSDKEHEVEWFPLSTKERFIADPFVMTDERGEKKLHVLYERYSFREKKGVIEHVSYENGFHAEPVTVLEEKTHLAYPYVFMDQGKFYLVPENSECNNISLYQSTGSPYKWKLKSILVPDFAGVDNTIIKKDGLYWLFTSNKNEGVNHNLHIFFAGTLLGRWTPHPGNPVKTDVRSSRCAGTPFIYQGEWYRPGMDYSEKIQGRITVNRIVELSTTEFSEVAVSQIRPVRSAFFSDKIHTLCEAGEFTLIDGCKEACILSDPIFFRYGVSMLFNKINIRLTGKKP